MFQKLDNKKTLKDFDKSMKLLLTESINFSQFLVLIE